MTLRDFNQLSTTAKAEVVDLWGDLLTEKVIPGHNVRVYQVDNFFVEVYYNTQQHYESHYRGCLRKETVYHS